MLISYSDLLSKYAFKPKGILHVGAHELEERADYLASGVDKIIWVEGNPSLVEKAQDILKNSNQEKILNGLIHSESDLEVDFKIANNSQSSSILEFGKHKLHHHHVDFIQNLKMKTITLYDLLEKSSIPRGDFDFINLDIQGLELQALKGMGDYFFDLKYIYSEINTSEVYKNNDTLDQIDSYLSQYGFSRVETYITEYEWGDAFYIR
jgi:FkbM family methyltransferase